ncbi:MAG: hypothetical protein U5L72_00615 [Bacteroidales bacterium]|nr:hypothetical protein [Bacteroidales bacterium]
MNKLLLTLIALTAVAVSGYPQDTGSGLAGNPQGISSGLGVDPLGLGSGVADPQGISSGLAGDPHEIGSGQSDDADAMKNPARVSAGGYASWLHTAMFEKPSETWINSYHAT